MCNGRTPPSHQHGHPTVFVQELGEVRGSTPGKPGRFNSASASTRSSERRSGHAGHLHVTDVAGPRRQVFNCTPYAVLRILVELPAGHRALVFAQVRPEHGRTLAS